VRQVDPIPSARISGLDSPFKLYRNRKTSFQGGKTPCLESARNQGDESAQDLVRHSVRTPEWIPPYRVPGLASLSDEIWLRPQDGIRLCKFLHLRGLWYTVIKMIPLPQMCAKGDRQLFSGENKECRHDQKFNKSRNYDKQKNEGASTWLRGITSSIPFSPALAHEIIFWRSLQRYPELGPRLGLNESPVYKPSSHSSNPTTPASCTRNSPHTLVTRGTQLLRIVTILNLPRLCTARYTVGQPH
jgi:hypothetical protein